MEGEIFCEGKTFPPEEFSLLFFVLFLLCNKFFSFLYHFNSWFRTKSKFRLNLEELKRTFTLELTILHLMHWNLLLCIGIDKTIFQSLIQA